MLSLKELDGLPDSQLIQLLQDGVKDAMTALVRRYRRLGLRISFRILQDREEAQDLMQEVFFEMFTKVKQFDAGRGDVRIWFLQFVYTRSMNRRKYLRRRRFYQTDEFEQTMPHTSTASNFYTGLDMLTLEERRRIIKGALQSLQEPHRRVVELACFHAKDMKEISELIKEPLVRTRNLHYYGLKKLRQIVDDLMQGRKEELDVHRTRTSAS